MTAVAVTPRELDPGATLGQARAWLRSIFGDAETGYIELRWIRPNRPSEQRWFALPNEIDQAVATILGASHDCYMGVAIRSRHGGKAEDVLAFPAVWTDIDEVPGLDDTDAALAYIKDKVLFAPSLLIQTSPGRWQVWWLFQESALAGDAARIVSVNKRLTHVLGGDANSCDAARVLRVPGSINTKPGRDGFVARLALCELDRRYGLDELDDAVPPLADCAPVTVGAPDIGAIAEGKRNATLTSFAGKMRRGGLEESEIAAALAAMNAERCDPRLPEAEVRKVAASISRYEPKGAPIPPESFEDLSGVHWPEPMDSAAFIGLPGDVVDALDPHTEAAREALLIQSLAYFGVNAGDQRFYQVEADSHPPRLYVVLVGDTAKGRKGTSLRRSRSLYEDFEDRAREVEGLSSGEGLIYQVRDPIEKKNKKGKFEVVDEGVEDKRLLVTEGEFARVLKVSSRDGNTLSPVLRTAWEAGNLDSLVKNNRVAATGAHVGIVGHITDAELRRHLSETEMANGMGNRILWLCVRRSKILPFGGSPDEGALGRLASRLARALAWVRSIPGRVELDGGAREVWLAVYPELSEGKQGLSGALIARAEAQVMRIALIYSLMAQSPVITAEHLRAGLAIQEYVEASVYYVFGDSLGDPMADEIARHLRLADSAGMSRTEIHTALGRNAKGADIGCALARLKLAGKADCTKEQGDGSKPVERWRWSIR